RCSLRDALPISRCQRYARSNRRASSASPCASACARLSRVDTRRALNLTSRPSSSGCPCSDSMAARESEAAMSSSNCQRRASAYSSLLYASNTSDSEPTNSTCASSSIRLLTESLLQIDRELSRAQRARLPDGAAVGAAVAALLVCRDARQPGHVLADLPLGHAAGRVGDAAVAAGAAGLVRRESLVAGPRYRRVVLGLHHRSPPPARSWRRCRLTVATLTPSAVATRLLLAVGWSAR